MQILNLRQAKTNPQVVRKTPLQLQQVKRKPIKKREQQNLLIQLTILLL
jgi:hypothetical protein